MASTPNLTRKTLVVLKRESTYNTDAFGSAANMVSSLTTSASCAQLLWDEINPISIDTKVVEKQVVRASFSKYTELIGRQLYMLKMKTMLMNSPGGQHQHTDSGAPTYDSAGLQPALGKPPFFGHILRACGVKEVANSSSSVVYTPVSQNFSSATAYVYADSIRHLITGLYGTAVIEGRAGEGIEVSFDMKGKYYDPSEAAIPSSIVYPLDKKAIVESESLTISSFTGAPIVRSFRFDLGTEVIERGDMNSTDGLYGLWITDRKPTLELVIEVENALTSTFNPFTRLNAQPVVTDAIAFTHGPSAGNLCTFSFPFAQLRSVNYQDDQGIRTYQLQYSLTSTTDDGEWSMTFH